MAESTGQVQSRRGNQKTRPSAALSVITRSQEINPSVRALETASVRVFTLSLP
jgi:hypothetical protein